MGKLVVSEFLTLDGVFEDPGGGESFDRGGWAFKFDRGEAGNEFKSDELRDAAALLLGRVTYEGFAKAWPSMNQDWFGQKMNSMPKYVVSSTLADPEWENSSVLSPETLAQSIDEVKRRHADGDILVAGSGRLVRALLENGLVDELRLMVYPTVLGSGRQLFAGIGEPVVLELTHSSPAGETMTLVYARK